LGNRVSPVMTLNGASSLFSGGNLTIGESAGSTGTLYVNGNSWIRGNPTRLGLNGGATGIVYIADSCKLTNANWFSIGTGSGSATAVGGVGTMVVKDNAILSSTGDFNVSDTPYSQGRLDILNNAQVLINGAVFLGKGVGTVGVINQYSGLVLRTGGGDWRIGGNDVTTVGTYNLSGGTLSVNANFQPGAYGQGTFNQTGGTALLGGWTSIGRYSGSIGVATISGGTLSATNTAADIIVGEAGYGTLTISGSGVVGITNNLRLGNLSGGMGVVNLNGGTLIARRVYLGNAGGSGTFNFNGGLLQAAPGASADFMSGLSSVNILGGGAFIDSAANNITITQDLYPDYISNGGLTKLGAGSLTLAGYLYYTGPTLVSAGKLALTTHAFSLGAITVADGSELGLQVLDYAGANLAVAGLTLGSATGATLDFDLGSFGNPSAAPCNVSGGTLTVNGAITLNIDPNSSLSVGQFPLIQFGSRAGAGTFVLGTLPPGVFAELVNTANTVELKVNSVFQPRWEGLAGGNWDVQLTTNWVDAISGEPQYFYQGSRAVFNDLASGVTTVNLTTNASPGGVLVSNSALVYTIQGPGRFTGGGGLTKLGAGTLTLSTTNNNYTGPTLIDEGGTLVSTVANNLGTNSALTIGSGALSLGANSQRFSSVTLTNGTIAASGATVTAASFNLENGSVSALLAGGSLSTFGATPGDMISVAGGNTYTGRTVLVGSLLVVTNLANGGSPSGIGASSANPTNLVFGGGGLGYSGPAVAIDRGYTVAGGGALNLDNDVALGGPVTSSSGNFAKGGPGKLTYGALGTNFLSRGGGANAYSIGAG
ncbi:MAG TPA: autotransporter-associated beta strand repeat-containing protein, partial [Bacillota bacterium]|nr:autotransporter-associated beta strand repeat-containing protein [Bacillota bacterium]